MKNFIFITIISLFILAGCSQEKEIEKNPKQATTIAMQEQQKDTMLVALEMNSSRVGEVQVYSMDNLLVYEKHQISEFVWMGIFFMGIIIMILIMVVIVETRD